LKFSPQSISDVFLIEPIIHVDDRGYFFETFRQDLFEASIGYKIKFVQDNEARSSRGVLRGLHYQIPPYSQSKLVRVTEGAVLDVVVDLRKNSASFGQHLAIELSAENKFQLFVPRGFAHGYVVLSNSATFTYKVDNIYSPKHDRGIFFNDSQLGIDWQLPLSTLQLSNKDRMHPNLLDVLDTDLFY
jgi:dTDP-4-dehydrorhamnose 3,5-epimerase